MNTMAFTPKDKENMKKLIKFLIEDYDSEEYYNEIHITSDGYCTIVEWENVPFDGTFGGRFEYIDEDHLVMKEVLFPDNHYEILSDSEEEDRFNEWLKENPGWYKNEWGTWTKTEDKVDESIFGKDDDELPGQVRWEDFINE